ncbi:YifB family Mg chelatase-like AAA ATPase [Lapillicoccus jejuensis]|uniref:Magnesium chelatase family protein n=1 Tax=Lapillicoccus jejuensis TaxID=402171 RepID=A0A542E3C3_9MICO|nr:YifB family Mg chelatase-like AAA ATPase [Lapillicoccus jejuensis]TQJ09841.1 magnesium chelatase family protein [Lapillicoccus jejuensis]
MTLGRTRAAGLLGLRGFVVEVEVDVAQGLPAFTVGGNPDRACKQSADRVKAAAANTGHQVAQRRVTVNLSPAAVPKTGSGFDLAICVAALVASGVLRPHVVERVVHIGELGLDGTVRPVRGVLPLVRAAADAGLRHVVVPVANATEAGLVPGVRVHPVAHLAELVGRYRQLADGLRPEPVPVPATVPDPPPELPDLVDVVGQVEARHALEVAAAGGHHLYLVGPPGAGKTMLAERLPGLLPLLDEEQAGEVTAVASIMGTLGAATDLIRRPPFVAPHHATSAPALVGGGSGPSLSPGAVTQAHHGVLFLDEAPELRRDALEALRQPVESGVVSVARMGATYRFPCRFQLVLAANPCPCGMGWGKAERCRCSPLRRTTYGNRLRGPLLDRVDIQVFVPAASRRTLALEPGEPTAVVAGRVAAARAVAAGRWSGTGVRVNAHVPSPVLRQARFRLPPAVTRDLDRAMDRTLLTMRGYVRCLRLAWTVADLRGADRPGRDDVGLALLLRHEDTEVAA